jgi:hypothetical protein
VFKAAGEGEERELSEKRNTFEEEHVYNTVHWKIWELPYLKCPVRKDY